MLSLTTHRGAAPKNGRLRLVARSSTDSFKRTGFPLDTLPILSCRSGQSTKLRGTLPDRQHGRLEWGRMPSWSAQRPPTMEARSSRESTGVLRTEDEWLWGWDSTPGIVSLWAEADGRAVVWRRIPETSELVREEARFRPWLLLDRLDDLRHLGARLRIEGTAGALESYRELEGPGALKYLVSSDDGRTLAAAVLEGATQRLARRVGHLRELGKETVLVLPRRSSTSSRRAEPIPQSLVRPTAPHAVRSGDDGARCRAGSDFHGRST